VGDPEVTRLLVVSDTHFSRRSAEATRNWSAVVRYSMITGPDLVIHAGDLSLDGARDPTDLEVARNHLDQLQVPWRAIPGNHDIGDNPSPSAEPTVNDERLQRWRKSVGPDRWSVHIGNWTLIGLNAQLFGSGLEAEAEQWEWLGDRFSDQATIGPSALFIHKPLTAVEGELASSPAYRFVPSSARRHLEQLLSHQWCPLVVSGHVHQFRVWDDEHRRLHTWAPTTWAVLPEFVQTTIGLKRCGVLSVTLSADGTAAVDMIEPPGLSQFTLVDDIANPYDH
jgi:3',5'-cyclic AMP phosphodiesterase CpdA